MPYVNLEKNTAFAMKERIRDAYPFQSFTSARIFVRRFGGERR